jgi:hypothetical protein
MRTFQVKKKYSKKFILVLGYARFRPRESYGVSFPVLVSFYLLYGVRLTQFTLNEGMGVSYLREHQSVINKLLMFRMIGKIWWYRYTSMSGVFVPT